MSIIKKGKQLSTEAKKVIILCSMVGLLVITGVLNFVLTSKIKPENNNENKQTAIETFFSSCRSDRETTRDQEISFLDSIITSQTASKEKKDSAEEKKQAILDKIETELMLETNIKAKGYNDVVVTISDKDIVSVIVDKAEMTSQEVAQILGIILQSTDYTASNVNVIPYSA